MRHLTSVGSSSLSVPDWDTTMSSTRVSRSFVTFETHPCTVWRCTGASSMKTRPISVTLPSVSRRTSANTSPLWNIGSQGSLTVMSWYSRTPACSLLPSDFGAFSMMEPQVTSMGLYPPSIPVP